MKLEVLLSCMKEASAESVIERSNIQTDSIIVNQCDNFGYDKSNINGKKSLFISCPERGIGLSRNTALSRSNADIVIFADDDETFVDGYEELVVNEFKKHQYADMIVFNVESLNEERPIYQNKKFKRLRIYNSLKYGTVRFAVRLDKVRQKNIHFSLLFGGGAKYSNGEDSIFISDILKSGLKVYASPIKIADVAQDGSSWFSGYNKKFFVDRGVLFRKIGGRLYPFLVIRFAFREYKKYKDEIGFIESVRCMFSMDEGAHE